MKRYILICALVMVTASLYAQSVWTGNAAVGGIADFPGESDVYRALSNSFPPGTVLKVTNPRGGRSVDVTVTGRLESPGVFLLMEQQAGDNISLPTDHVVPVRVTPHSANTEISTPSQTLDDSALSQDSDFNPAASISPEDEMAKTVELAEEPAGETLSVPVEPYPFPPEQTVDDAEVATTEAGNAGDDLALNESPVPVEIPETVLPEEEAVDGLEIEKIIESAGPEEPESVGPPVTPETILLYDLASSEPENGSDSSADGAELSAGGSGFSDARLLPDETVGPESSEDGNPDDALIAEDDLIPVENVLRPESASPFGKDPKETAKAWDAEIPPEMPEPDTAIDEGESVFFLMPSDPKPPVAPENDTAVVRSFETGENNEAPDAGANPSRPAAFDRTGATGLARVSSGGSYVQIGAYRSLSILEDSARRIETTVPGYPLSYAEAGSGSSRIYRLLVGPLKPAEVGVVLQTARNSSFPDAFPYSP